MKFRHVTTIALIAITMCSTSAFCDSAEEMLAACKSVVANAKLKGKDIIITKNFDSGQCWGAFGVLQEEDRWVDASGHKVLGVCTPSEARRSELIAVFVDYLRRHPQRQRDDFAAVALDAFGQHIHASHRSRTPGPLTWLDREVRIKLAEGTSEITHALRCRERDRIGHYHPATGTCPFFQAPRTW